MIKKEELRLGNWVKIPKNAYYYDEEDFDEGYTQVTSLSSYELNTYSLKEISYDEIEGIPLTGEILEKIGFQKDGYTNLSSDYLLEIKDDFSIAINIKPTCDKHGQIWVENKHTKHVSCLEIPRFSMSDKTLYVHQLQNLLSVVGVDFPIEL